jgi:DNA-binding transcriptional LysR family regulator
MELRHLRYFIAVAEELHFGRAAERLHMAQPPLSQQIQALERELGVRLFDRSKRQVALTAAGKAFLEAVYPVFTQVDRAVSLARQVDRGAIGRLRVGFVSSAAYNVLPEIIRRFHDAFPDVVLDLSETTTDVQQAQLMEGDIDLALFRLDLVPERPPAADGFILETVVREPFIVAMPEAHPLAAASGVTLAHLASEPFIQFPRRLNPGLHDQITRLCESAGFTPRIAQEALLMQTIVSLVSAGLGIALVPASLENLHRAGVVYRPLLATDARSEMVAMWRQHDPSPVLAAFVTVMRDVARSMEGR